MPPMYERRWPFALRLKKSVIPRIILKIIVLTGFSAIIVALNQHVTKLDIGSQAVITILGMVTSLLLVFRTNTAYDRYWEGRRLWSTQMVNLRNLTRLIWVNVGEKSPQDHKLKQTAVNLLVAFAYATKHYLREEYDYSDITPDMVPFLKSSHLKYRTPTSIADQREQSLLRPIVKPHESKAAGSNLPLEITIHLTSFIQHQKDAGNVDAPLFTLLTNTVSSLTDCLTGFERILRTPIPMAYSIHLSQTVWFYLIMLPFQLASTLKWVTCLVVALASFTLFGILAIGGELENPFGYDWNDLPLDSLCAIAKSEMQTITSVPPPSIDSWFIDEPTSPVKIELTLDIPPNYQPSRYPQNHSTCGAGAGADDGVSAVDGE
ncbi:UPF0187-domain-containing protein [Basidiobolus meristosporus CBS 931.73]|uniref:UPF0187-domain-containing protein n=1 Tax=Basidiobolus meristosporus CBS 931.73 TaxID=1314790 RepID=A0A1Y1ZEP7_9FUNG|nr:UPF0187-domain-containing protein [Basidiobolus meristosporus CBS 931.73]|eukprot:ORY08437.1 UPF0187-domain-containing protein [Basidiobolus meristosporus CBS 931.73]